MLVSRNGRLKMPTVLTILLFALYGGNRTLPYYHGRVIDENQNPVAGVRVFEMYREHSVETDKNGYFRISKSPDWIDDLVFRKSGYLTDTIASVWHQHGETTEYNFINKDTTVVTLQAAR